MNDKNPNNPMNKWKITEVDELLELGDSPSKTPADLLSPRAASNL